MTAPDRSRHRRIETVRPQRHRIFEAGEDVDVSRASFGACMLPNGASIDRRAAERRGRARRAMAAVAPRRPSPTRIWYSAARTAEGELQLDQFGRSVGVETGQLAIVAKFSPLSAAVPEGSPCGSQ